MAAANTLSDTNLHGDWGLSDTSRGGGDKYSFRPFFFLPSAPPPPPPPGVVTICL